MREIKFRVWQDNKMWDGDNIIAMKQSVEVASNWQVNYSLDFFFKEHSEKGGYVFMQYTGLKDKNGKEIYEGDILRRDDAAIGIVEWIEKEAGFLVKLIKGDVVGNFDQSQEEIIGNIYENPELLK